MKDWSEGHFLANFNELLSMVAAIPFAGMRDTVMVCCLLTSKQEAIKVVRADVEQGSIPNA
jgi:hypothetical protein